MKVTFPNHMEAAVKAAIDAFSKDGFIYSINSQQSTVKNEGSFTMDIDANGQEFLNLGIKIGYKLKEES